MVSVIPLSFRFRTPPTPVPAIASTWGFNRLAFEYVASTDGLTTIDTTNSKEAGFKWYVNNAWPNVPNSSVWSTCPSTQVGDLSISGTDTLVLARDRSTFGQGLNTAAALSGTNYVGLTFPAGWYFECQYSAAVPTVGAGSWAAIWSESIQFMTGQITSGNRFNELDFMERLGTTDQAHLHTWLYNGSYNDSQNGGILISADTALHTVGGLWVPTSLNSGTGLWQSYIDGVHVTAQDVSYNTSNNYFIGEAQSYSLILGAGTNPTDGNIPLNIKYVRLWQV